MRSRDPRARTLLALQDAPVSRRAELFTYGDRTLTARQWLETPEAKAAGLTYGNFLARWKRTRDMAQVLAPVKQTSRGVRPPPRPAHTVDLQQLARDVAFITRPDPIRIRMKTTPLGAERWSRIQELARELEVLEMSIVAKRLELKRLLES